MAKLDFPDRDQSPWTNPDTGITYVWKGGTQGAWHIASAGDTDIFVAKTGDKMTGDLTLGPEGDTKITLDATNGNATFASEIKIDGSRLSLVQETPGSIEQNMFIVYDTYTGGGEKAVFKSDGALLIGGTDITGTQATAQPNIRLSAGGSAAFAGNITQGSSTTYVNGTYDEGASSTGNGFKLGSFSNNSAIQIQSPSTAPSEARSFIIWKGQDKTVDIRTSGTAEFAGAVDVGPFDPSDNNAHGIRLTNTATAYFQGDTSFTANNAAVNIGYGVTSGNILLNYNGNATFNNQVTSRVAANSDICFSAGVKGQGESWRVNGAGTASFRNAILNLEPDNDDNYTVTTNVDEEGNTVESRVYNGPTLDVKERLQNLIARLDSLEAEELADDATSTLLLTTVNNLNADMTKTKAALTAIRTAANAAGTLEQLKADIATATADI